MWHWAQRHALALLLHIKVWMVCAWLYEYILHFQEVGVLLFGCFLLTEGLGNLVNAVVLG